MTKRVVYLFVCCLVIAVSQHTHAQGTKPVWTWGNVHIGGGGFVSAIIANPLEEGLFYARTDVGGAYRWDNGQSKWISMMDWAGVDERGLLGVEAIAVDPQNADKVYMVAGTSYWNDGRSAFLRSSDRGRTWEAIYTWDEKGDKGAVRTLFGAHGNGMGRGNGEALTIDPNDPSIMFYGSKNKGLFKSTNNGSTWAKVNSFTTAAGSDTTWNGSGFSFVTFSPNSSDILYAGFLRAKNNVFRSTNGGSTWSVIPNRPEPATRGGYKPPLMPQRIAITNDGSLLYITFGDGAGPHTMRWDEGWGDINDWFNRGAVLKYDVTNNIWTDVSPENLVDYGGDKNYDVPDEYLACYGGIAINPANPLELTVAAIGYRWPQYWKNGNTWTDQWGTGIFHSKDGGQNWVNSIKAYWIEGGYTPPVEQMNENGIGWMFNSSIHWTGSLAMDPFNPKRLWATSGNGVFRTDDVTDYRDDPDNWDWETNKPSIIQETIWKVMSHGIEETVPYEVISIPGGPLVSVILDYDGFRHDDIAAYPGSRHLTDVSGTISSLGNTRTLAYAPKSGRLVKAVDALTIKTTYDVPISPIQFSSDSGRTWTVAAHESHDLNGDNYKGALSSAISADGQVVLLTPISIWDNSTETDIDQPVKRYANSAWSSVAGIDGAFIVGDPIDANVFYAYNRRSGKMSRSKDKGMTFGDVASPGASSFYKIRLVPDKEGDIWVPLGNDGLTRSLDGGETWNKISAVSYCEAVGFGRAPITERPPQEAFPTVFIFGTVNNVMGVFMSTDEGETWIRANDDDHEYGGLANGEFVVGDMNVFGRIYMSTAGRGIVYGDITGSVAARPAAVRSAVGARGVIKIRGAALSIRADNSVTHQISIFDLKGRILYKRTIMGTMTVSMKNILPKGNYVVAVKRDGVNVHRGKLRIVK